jgi:hypothetical protein
MAQHNPESIIQRERGGLDDGEVAADVSNTIITGIFFYNNNDGHNKNDDDNENESCFFRI